MTSKHGHIRSREPRCLSRRRRIFRRRRCNRRQHPTWECAPLRSASPCVRFDREQYRRGRGRVSGPREGAFLQDGPTFEHGERGNTSHVPAPRNRGSWRGRRRSCVVDACGSNAHEARSCRRAPRCAQAPIRNGNGNGNVYGNGRRSGWGPGPGPGTTRPRDGSRSKRIICGHDRLRRSCATASEIVRRDPARPELPVLLERTQIGPDPAPGPHPDLLPFPYPLPVPFPFPIFDQSSARGLAKWPQRKKGELEVLDRERDADDRHREPDREADVAEKDPEPGDQEP
jgi:hypothetical protein